MTSPEECPFRFPDGEHHPVDVCVECGFKTAQPEPAPYPERVEAELVVPVIYRISDRTLVCCRVVHEYGIVPGFSGKAHRLLVDGRAGPWTSRHDIAVNGDLRATTEVHRNILPRIFVAIDLIEANR